MFGLDYLLIGLVCAALPVCVWKPWIGVLLFTWLGCMHPHRIIGGVAFDAPLSKLVAAATLVGLLFTRERYRMPRRIEVYLLAALWLTFVASTLLGAVQPERAQAKLVEVSKIWLMAGVTLVLFQDRTKVRLLLLVIALSIGALAVGGVLRAYAGGFRANLVGPPGTAITSRNIIALVATMSLPLLVLLRRELQGRWLSAALLPVFGMAIMAVIATYSRGGFLGLVVVLALLALHLRTSDKALIAAALVACALLLVMPPRWSHRMQTMTSAAPRTDSSGVKRVKAWYVAYRTGADNPLLGAGFYPFTVSSFETHYPGYGESQDAHNHLLQVFAEHGLTGLGLYVALLISVLVHLRRLLVNASGEREWIGNYAAMIGIAVIAFVFGGLFVNLPYCDVYVQLVAVTVVLQELASPAGPPSPVGESLLAEVGRAFQRPPTRPQDA